jgi:hypothetical protein
MLSVVVLCLSYAVVWHGAGDGVVGREAGQQVK